ncbi:MAG: hypothetical protein JXB48_21795 [Candidatus Latescibacteria bacterium]|nr:hypothetical protein [Candidatus Latescibacterota bacterium]
MGKHISRRDFLSGSTAAGLGSMVYMHSSDVHAGYVKFETQKLNFMDQYYYGALEIVKGIRDTQIDNISAAMEKAYELQVKGGKVRSHINYGHFAMFAGSKDRPGQPWVLPQPGITPKQEEYNELKEGDFIITSRVSPEYNKLRDRGVYVVGVTNNYYRFSRTPPGGLRESNMELALEDISDLVIDSQVPWDNGLVHAPQIPQVALCPSSGLCQFAVYWACTASLANLIGTKGKGSASEPAQTYLDILYERFEMIGTDRAKVDWIAGRWVDLVLQKGARMLVYGHPQDVEPYDGARNIFVNDAYICASSSMIADQYEKKADDLRDTDIVLIGAFTSDNKLEIDVARRARSVGTHNVAFCPYGTDGDISGPRLFKEVDYAFNTYSDESAGVIEVKGFEKKVSPVSGLTGDLVLWMLTAQWTDHMCRRGEAPYYWKGYHETGGREYDDLVHPYFLERGY